MAGTMPRKVKAPKPSTDTGRAIRVRQEVYVKLVQHQMDVLTRTGKRPTLADIIANAVEKL